MRAGHGENVRRAIDEGGGERLTAQPADIDALLFANVDCMQARRLSADRVDAGGRDFDIPAVAEQSPEQAFSHRAAADIASADKENAFHGDGTGAHAGLAN
jgi:hypothetical protein